MIAAGFLAGLVAASCGVDDAAEFNDEALTLACEIQTKCDADVTTAIELDIDVDPADGPCGVQIRDDFQACADNCGFKATAARKCIRRLEKMVDGCETVNLSACRRVYRDCDVGFDGVNRCDLWSCSVDANPSPAGALIPLGLLALGALGRRRRRRA